MARNVFISFLGTNNYKECRYSFGGQTSQPVRFVQEALIAHLCQDWGEEDRILIFCTSQETTGEAGAKELNWQDNGQPRPSADIERIGLEHRLCDLKATTGLKPAVEEVDIEAGFSEEEIWGIFNTVYSHLRPGDRIIFDVTHAFRSIPLFSIVLFNYARLMLGTQLMAILYGAFEKLGPAYKVGEMPMDQRVAPVIDLTNIARLQEYSQVAAGLRDFGKVRQIGMAIHAENTAEAAIADLGTSIANLDEYINTIDMKKIKAGKYIINFRNNYKFVKRKQSLVAPIANILDRLYEETADFVAEDSYKNIEAAINWTIRHDMLMQAFPLAEEYIILRVADMLGDLRPKEMKSKKEFRMFTAAVLGMPAASFEAKNWDKPLSSYPDVADALADDFLVRELRPDYDRIRSARNSLAHGNGAITYTDLKKLIPTIISCIERVNAAYTTYPSTKLIMNTLC